MRRAVPPPLPSTVARVGRPVRAVPPALPAERANERSGDGEAPTLYARVGRRSSPGMPAVSVSVDSIGPIAPPPASTAPMAQAAAPPAPAPLRAARDAELEGPPTEKRSRPPLSVRPPAPEPFSGDASSGESIANTFDKLLGSELDSRFAQLKRDSARPTAPGAMPEAPADLGEVRALFEQLAANHVRPVRELVIDLRWGEASRDWIGLCSPAVESLRRAAERLSLGELEAALAAFAGALDAAAAEQGAFVEGAGRDRVLVAYDALVAVLPKAFALDMDRAQRESLIVQSILLQIPEVRRVTIENLYAAGVSEVAMLADARPRELSEIARIPLDVAARIVEAFGAYRDERHTSPRDVTSERERAELDTLLNDLESQHAAFEWAADAWTPAAADEKKRLRRARHQTLMAISVRLARLGEVALLHSLEKLPWDRKLEGLREYLKAARTDAAPAPQ